MSVPNMEVLDPARVAELFHAARGGNRAAYVELVRSHCRRAYRYAYALTRDPDRAAALTRESFIRAWRGIVADPGASSFFPWILRCMRELFAAGTGRGTAPTVTSPTHSGGSKGDPASEELHARARLEQCALEAFAGLRIEDQHALAARLTERLSYEEIESLLELPSDAVGERVSAARGLLSQSLRLETGEPL